MVITSLFSSICSLHPLCLIWVPGGLLQYGFPHDSFLGLWEQRGDCGHATRRQTVLMDILWTDTDVNTTPAALWGRDHVLLSLNVFFVSYITYWKKFLIYFWRVNKQLPSQIVSLNGIYPSTIQFRFIEVEMEIWRVQFICWTVTLSCQQHQEAVFLVTAHCWLPVASNWLLSIECAGQTAASHLIGMICNSVFVSFINQFYDSDHYLFFSQMVFSS